MSDLKPYKLSMTGQEADTGIRVGMQIGTLNGIPYSNGNNEISEARPGTDYGYPLLQGNGPPTANTAANFGQHYYDLSATEPPYEYICVAFTESGGFVWKSHDDAAMHAAIYNAYVTATAFGAIAEIDDGADNIPVKSLMVDIDPAQAGSGEPSPTNVRPISGWTGAKVTKAGLESDTTGIYNISFPAEAGTVYGGTLDVTNGVLTVDKAYYQFNGTETPGSMAEFTTVKRATFRLSALGLPDAMAMAGVSNSGKTGLFSHGKYLSAWSGTSADVPHGYADVSNLHTYLPFENATSDSVKAYFSSQAQNGTPVQIVYSLATPITYQLTPLVIKTLLGINNFWADTGDVNVSYRADPTLIYNKLTAAIISSSGI